MAKSPTNATQQPPRRQRLATAIIACAAATGAAIVIADDATATSPAENVTAAEAVYYRQWDWKTGSELSPEQRCHMQTGCDGTYVAPDADWEDADLLPEDAALRATAANSELLGNEVKLQGDVELSQGHRHLTADRATLDRNSGDLELEGNIVIREPGQLLRCDSASLNQNSGFGSFDNSRILMHDSGIRLTADQFNRPSDTVFELQGASYTQCSPDIDLWRFDADEITIDTDEGWGEARHAVLRIKEMPVFYTPYITFPIDDRRKTGFLWPTIASSDGGLDLAVPYYFNIAPQADATLTPRYVSRHGTMYEAEGRYMNDYSHWTVAGALLTDDSYREKDEDRVNYQDEDRWLHSVQEQGRFNSNWSHGIDYTLVSDDDYFRDFNIESLEVKRQTNLNQQANLNFNSQSWKGQLLVSQFQEIDTRFDSQHKRLPQLSIDHVSSAYSFEPQYLLGMQYTDFDHSEAKKDGGKFDTGERYYGETGVSFPMRWTPGFIIPSVKARHVSYELEGLNPGEESKPATTVPSASLDMGLFFERQLQFTNSSFTQTLEPRLYYLYSDYEDQSEHPNFDSNELQFSYNQLFRDSRFSGNDLLDDANQMTIGVTTRFLDNDSGQEVWTLSAGQIFYFEDRRVQDIGMPEDTSNSEIAAEVQYQPHSQLWFNAAALWDSRQDKLNESNLSVHYKQDNGALYNASHRYVREDIISQPRVFQLEQADFSIAYPIHKQWNVYSRFRYDVKEDRSLEDMFGIGYEDCCWMARVVYQRAVDDEFLNHSNPSLLDFERDHRVVFQFQLKGLGGMGNKAETIFEESILGYQ